MEISSKQIRTRQNWIFALILTGVLLGIGILIYAPHNESFRESVAAEKEVKRNIPKVMEATVRTVNYNEKTKEVRVRYQVFGEYMERDVVVVAGKIKE